jgi:hypothetical protein
MKRICTVTTATDCYILLSECFADTIEIRVFGKYEREYRHPAYRSGRSVRRRRLARRGGSEDFHFVLEFFESFQTQFHQLLFMFPDFLHASDGCDIFNRFCQRNRPDDIRCSRFEFVGIGR